jgi:hypothetical protein
MATGIGISAIVQNGSDTSGLASIVVGDAAIEKQFDSSLRNEHLQLSLEGRYKCGSQSCSR